MIEEAPQIEVRNLTMAYGSKVIMKDLNFSIEKGEIFAIMGGSGCGKSTLLRHLIGLNEPARGEVLYHGESFTRAPQDRRAQIMRGFGVLYQSGALWSALTLAENVAMPLEEYTDLRASEIAELVRYKLALVGLSGFESYYPADISGGMKKRAAFARAMALDPEVLFFDEPSAGLDPITSRRLDELIVQISESMDRTVVLVTHELASLLSIAKRAIFLDVTTKTQAVIGDPRELKERSDLPQVREFLNRGDGPVPCSS
ncbi:ATP-binding cassette domain-containing protein [Haloferula luteola]